MNFVQALHSVSEGETITISVEADRNFTTNITVGVEADVSGKLCTFCYYSLKHYMFETIHTVSDWCLSPDIFSIVPVMFKMFTLISIMALQNSSQLKYKTNCDM